MRRCQKKAVSTERRQLVGQIKGTVVVTVVQVTLTVVLNGLLMAALSWAR
ncbi:hypothetical protein [Streptomyces sp. NPDC050546]|jgi:hypothetical protein